MSTLNKKRKKILLENLPEDWKKQGAVKFGMSESYIEKIAYGQKVNIDILEFLTEIAATNKAKILQKKLSIEATIDRLAKPIKSIEP